MRRWNKKFEDGNPGFGEMLRSDRFGWRAAVIETGSILWGGWNVAQGCLLKFVGSR